MELFVFLVIDTASFVGYQCNDVGGLSIAWELLPRGGGEGLMEARNLHNKCSTCVIRISKSTNISSS